MGSSANENIAIEVRTSADLTGTRATRADLSALGRDAAAAAQQIEQASTGAVTAENSLAAAATKAAGETGKLKVSADQMRDALAKTGGDLTRAAQLLAEVAVAETKAAVATESLTAATVQETAATEQAVASDDKLIRQMGLLETAALKEDKTRAAAAERELSRLGKLESAAYAEGASRAAAAKKAADAAEVQGTALANVSPKARTAANAVGILSQAAVTGTGSVAGLAAAAGNLSTGLASVASSAKVAAAATGIGAVVTLIGVAYGIYHDFTEQTKHAKERVADLTSELRGLDSALGGNQLGQQLEQIQTSTEGEIRQAKELKFHDKERDQIIAGIVQKRERLIALAVQENDRSVAKEVAGLELQAAGSAEARYRASAKLIELERQDQARRGVSGANAAAAGQLRQLGKAGDDELQNVTNQAAAVIGQLQGAHEARRRTIEADYAQELRSLDEATLRDGQRAQILDNINNKREYSLKLLDQETRARRAELTIQAYSLSDNVGDQFRGRQVEIEKQRLDTIRETGLEVDATRVAELQKRALRRETARQANEDAKTILDVVRSTNNATLKAVGTFGENIRRVVIGAEAARSLVRAAYEGAEAIASLAMGDFAGAALHGAAAVQFGAAAALGARESLGGGGGGGGASAGGSSAGSGGGSTFSSNNSPSGSGNVVVNLFTTDPYNRENIMIASYELNRAGIMNRPIYLPPTSGLAMAGA